MKNRVFALAALAVIEFSGAAFAGEAATGAAGQKAAPVAMTDAEMDKVVAGIVVVGGLPEAAMDNGFLQNHLPPGPCAEACDAALNHAAQFRRE